MRSVVSMVIVLATILANGTALADTSRESKIEYIIETENVRGQIIAYSEQLIIRTVEELNKEPGIDLDENQKENIRKELKEIVADYIDDYVNDLAQIYNELLTDSEIDGLYNFYRSPEGISIGNKLPEAWSKFFWVDARYIQLLSERSVSRVTEVLSQDGAD